MADADRLFAVPLEDFMDERKRLAKEVRAAGDRAAAAEIAKFPKPSPPAWALNHLARERPEALAGWLEAAGTLRDASTRAAEVGGDALRSAMAAHREATARLLTTLREEVRPAGKPLSPPMLERAKALLQAATVDEGRAAALRGGRVTEDDSAPEMPPSSPAPASARTPERDAQRERRAEVERQAAAAEAEVDRLRTQAAERERAARVAEERLEDARRTLQRTETEAEAAHGALTDAGEALAAAERELQQLRGLLARRQ